VPVVLAIATFTTFTSSCLGLVEFGAYVDGPGIGLLDSPGSLLWVALVATTSFVVAIVTLQHWPWKPWLGLASGFGAFLALVLSGAPRVAFERSWTRRCLAGNDLACNAELRHLGQGTPRRRDFARRGCRSPVGFNSCVALVEENADLDAEELDSVCRSLASTCSKCRNEPCGGMANTCERVNARCPTR
jgi:hypothetical protein